MHFTLCFSGAEFFSPLERFKKMNKYRSPVAHSYFLWAQFLLSLLPCHYHSLYGITSLGDCSVCAPSSPPKKNNNNNNKQTKKQEQDSVFSLPKFGSYVVQMYCELKGHQLQVSRLGILVTRNPSAFLDLYTLWYKTCLSCALSLSSRSHSANVSFW